MTQEATLAPSPKLGPSLLMRTCSLLVLLGSPGNMGDSGNGGCNDDDCEGRGDYDGAYGDYGTHGNGDDSIITMIIVILVVMMIMVG